MIFDLFKTRDVQIVAKTLVQDFCKLFPPTLELQPDRKSSKKFQGALENLAGQAVHFKRTAGLNWFRKAFLGNAIKWELRQLGYSTGFSDEIVNYLILRLSKSKK
jgi:hypothetical protein